MHWESKWRGRNVLWQFIQIIMIFESYYDTHRCFDDNETTGLAIVIYTNETLQKLLELLLPQKQISNLPRWNLELD
jgi:ABC-type uncharacterized transport system permease subunit